jgi:hypothetical protein
MFNLRINLGILAVYLMLAPVQLMALPVTGLYSHEIAVSSQTDAERSRAFREALAAVLLKVTGERRWLENSALQRALDNAQSFVEAIDPRTEIVSTPAPEPDLSLGPQLPLPPIQTQREYITVNFARDLIDRLLADSAIPVWDNNRPSVLVWMALQNDAGERTLLSTETNAEIIELIQQFANERGLPIIFPVLDFEDRRNLSADLIWSLDEQAIARASARYGADSVLSGRLHITASGDLVGLWQFIFQDEIEVFDSLDTELQRYINDPLERVTSKLAQHFSIVASRNGNEIVRLRVEGVRSLGSYSSLLGYLNNLNLVESVGISRIEGQILELELTLQGDQRQLQELIALDRDLLPLSVSVAERQSVFSYRWTR